MFQTTVFDGGSFSMQCPSCRAVFSNGLDVCPRCKTQASKPGHETAENSIISSQDNLKSAASVSPGDDMKPNSRSVATPSNSTLIEFPGVSRAQRPVWRAELSERVREIQERRARDAEAEAEEAAQ